MEHMFFRRPRPHNFTFPERLENVRRAGFQLAPAPSGSGATRVSRNGCAVELKEADGTVVSASPAGILMGDEIGALIDGGYQKFFRTPAGRRKPALADDLKALHAFEEDLKEALGQESYYNDSLGTVSTYYLYDRVKDRDLGVPKRVWEG